MVLYPFQHKLSDNLSWTLFLSDSIGQVNENLALFRLASERLLQEENILFFSFFSDFETVADLNNYRDKVHHSNQINSLLLERFHSGEYQLTKENYLQHWQEVEDFYQHYDYEALFP